MTLSEDLRQKAIAISMGDVNGIGPEILAKALARPEILALGEFVIYGDVTVYERAISLAPGAPPSESLVFCDADSPAPLVQPGTLCEKAGACAHDWISAAALAVLNGELRALVTCPVNKEAMLLAQREDLGHTEILSRLSGTSDWRMCLYADQRLVVHLSGHLPLRAALDAVTESRIVSSVRMAHEALIASGIDVPRIAVAGLNPHAGEHGLIGMEDEAILVPAVAACRDLGYHCSGPHSPDAVFRQLWDRQHDAVIALYHDQGHIAMKMIAMDQCASLTLGLPMVRTSPDHGTAFDIAWRGVANEESLCCAIALAAKLSRAR